MKKQNIVFAFIIPIIAVIILLAAQAFCDLELPSYTSDIINNGIQQGGIESGLPEVLTTTEYNAILRILEEDPAILASYDLYIADNLSKDELTKLEESILLSKMKIYIF